MSKKTVLNENYKGLVESLAIPAEIHEGAGGKYASFGSAVPIHRCTPEQVAELSNKTHHVCDIFTEQLPAQLEELAYVRIDENTAEKVFINRSKRILVRSSDGQLAQWRSAATFESANTYVAGAPIVNAHGELLSLVTAKRGNHYAVSNFEGDGGYFDTPQQWKVVETPAGWCVYGDRSFPSRAQLRAHAAGLPPLALSAASPPTPVLHLAPVPRIALVAPSGRQISHTYVQGVIASQVEYL